MSYEYTALVWKQSRSSGNARLVMLMLADMANQGGVCWPSIAYVATHVRCSTRSVQQAIRDLVALGELEVKMNAAPGGANLYQLKLAAALPLGSGIGDRESGIGDRKRGKGGEDISGGEKSSGVKNFQGGDEKYDGGGVKNFREGGEDISPESVIEPAIEPVIEVVATTTGSSLGMGDGVAGRGAASQRESEVLTADFVVDECYRLYPELRKKRPVRDQDRRIIRAAVIDPQMKDVQAHYRSMIDGVAAMARFWKESGDDPQFMYGIGKFFKERMWESDWSLEASPAGSSNVEVLVTPEEEARQARIRARVAAIREQAEAEADRDGVPDGERSAYVERRMKELQLRRAS